MVSLLEGAMRAKLAAGFKGKICKGVLRRETAGGLDNFGDPTGPTVVSYPFDSGIRGTFSAFYKAQAEIPDTDVSILILLGSFKTNVTPKQDDKVYLDAPFKTWYQVRKVLEIDPANASCNMQAYEIPAP